MNIALDLSKGQLSKLRNGHGIRINPTMFGSGVDLIVDPMTYHNMAKKLDKDKGVIIKLGMSEIDMNKMEGTGLFAGAGNKSGKISRIKKAKKWRDFSNDTARMGIDTAKYGYEQYKEAMNPVGSKVKKMLGFGAEEIESDEEVEGGKISLKGIKKAYNKNVKNSALGKAVRQSAENLISDGYDRATEKIGKTKHFKSIAEHLENTRQGSIRKATQMSGLGVRDRGKGKQVFRPAVMPTAMPISRGKGLKLSGDGMRMSGGMCCGCGMMNDHFIFANASL
jgi:hypothetical protein